MKFITYIYLCYEQTDDKGTVTRRVMPSPSSVSIGWPDEFRQYLDHKITLLNKTSAGRYYIGNKEGIPA